MIDPVCAFHGKLRSEHVCLVCCADEDWRLALMAVFGARFESPEDFVRWAHAQALEWTAP